MIMFSTHIIQLLDRKAMEKTDLPSGLDYNRLSM
jgi:hypothetical protein